MSSLAGGRGTIAGQGDSDCCRWPLLLQCATSSASLACLPLPGVDFTLLYHTRIFHEISLNPYEIPLLLLHRRHILFLSHTHADIIYTRWPCPCPARVMYTLVIYQHHPQQRKKHYRGHSGMPTTIHMQMDKYLELIPYILPFPAASQGACICELPLPLLLYPDITIDRLYPCR